MRFKVTTELDGLNRLKSERVKKRAGFATLQLMQRQMEPLVPMRGDNATNLRGSSYLDQEQNAIIYNKIYARSQFYGFITDKDGGQHRIRHYTTDGTGRRWDLRGKQLHMAEWSETYRKGLLKRD